MTKMDWKLIKLILLVVLVVVDVVLCVVVWNLWEELRLQKMLWEDEYNWGRYLNRVLEDNYDFDYLFGRRKLYGF